MLDIFNRETMDIISYSEQSKVSKVLMDILWVLSELGQIALAGLGQQVWDSLGQFGTVHHQWIFTILRSKMACPGRQATETC